MMADSGAKTTFLTAAFPVDDEEWPRPTSPLPTADETRRMRRAQEDYLSKIGYPFCDDTDKFETLVKIGQGTFGEVFKAREKSNPKKIVAMKKVLMENEREGFPITALREIRILQLLRHENIVNLLEICQTKDSKCLSRSTFYLIFEFCEHDLAGLLSNSMVTFNLGEIKQVIKQMLNGLYYIHQSKILHRDMKSANVLITKTGTLKLADFGLARAFSIPKIDQPNKYSNRVVTLWYRPPELLLGERNYGPPIDIWGAGCIMAEMWTRRPIMQGTSEQKQLMMISKLCGSITPEVWPKVVSLDLFNKLKLSKGEKRTIKEQLNPFIRDTLACDLLDKLLTLDPEKRLDADNALNHDFFWKNPMPSNLSKVMSQLSTSNYEFFMLPRRITNLQSTAKQPLPAIVNKGKSELNGTSGVH